MIVLVGGTDEISLLEPDDFTRFSVRLAGHGLSEEIRVEGAYAWVPIERLRAQAPEGDPKWPAKFDRMIDFARSRGWVNDLHGTLRGHIERT